MENTITKYGIILGIAIALPKTILGLIEFLKWIICFLGLLFIPRRTEKALGILSKHFGSQTIFTTKVRDNPSDALLQIIYSNDDRISQ